jgi:hypothetical protein
VLKRFLPNHTSQLQTTQTEPSRIPPKARKYFRQEQTRKEYRIKIFLELNTINRFLLFSSGSLYFSILTITIGVGVAIGIKIEKDQNIAKGTTKLLALFDKYQALCREEPLPY